MDDRERLEIAPPRKSIAKEIECAYPQEPPKSNGDRRSLFHCIQATQIRTADELHETEKLRSAENKMLLREILEIERRLDALGNRIGVLEEVGQEREWFDKGRQAALEEARERSQQRFNPTAVGRWLDMVLKALAVFVGFAGAAWAFVEMVVIVKSG